MSKSNERAAAPSEPMRRCVVAVPVRDEAERLPACLNALAAQRAKIGRSSRLWLVWVVLFANNCRDESAELRDPWRRTLPSSSEVVEASLLPDFAHAGGARREAMDIRQTIGCRREARAME